MAAWSLTSGVHDRPEEPPVPPEPVLPPVPVPPPEPPQSSELFGAPAAIHLSTAAASASERRGFGG